MHTIWKAKVSALFVAILSFVAICNGAQAKVSLRTSKMATTMKNADTAGSSDSLNDGSLGSLGSWGDFSQFGSLGFLDEILEGSGSGSLEVALRNFLKMELQSNITVEGPISNGGTDDCSTDSYDDTDCSDGMGSPEYPSHSSSEDPCDDDSQGLPYYDDASITNQGTGVAGINGLPPTANPNPGTVSIASTTVNAQSPCTEVSLMGDATFCVSGNVCSGNGTTPHGSECPKAGDVAVSDCYSYLKSWNEASNRCITTQDSICRKNPNEVWGCVYVDEVNASTNSSPNVATNKNSKGGSGSSSVVAAVVGTAVAVGIIAAVGSAFYFKRYQQRQKPVNLYDI